MKKILSIFISLLIITSNIAIAEEDSSAIAVVNSTAQYLYATVANPEVGSIGGEWTVLGLARCNADIPEEYFEKYYENVEITLKSNNGILHDKKYTEYSRVVIALTAIGKSPQNVAGYNLLLPLIDYNKNTSQGINGATWALIALDCGNYDIPQNTDAEVTATREMYINYILKNQCSDGGWALSGNTADADITGMVLLALSKYQDNPNVKSATERAILCMSEAQKDNGGFASYNTENSESTAQMITALCELGISPTDSRFTKNGVSLLDNLMSYKTGAGFKHTYDNTDINLMATEQCLYALTATQRLLGGKCSLYTMDDVTQKNGNTTEIGLIGKNPDVQKAEIISENKTFDDIKGHINQTEIEELAKRNIINGKSDTAFEPSATMTRAEFATIITRGLGLSAKSNSVFTDVSENDWFYNYVNTAYSYGIVNGVSDTEFNPNGTITREEAAVMIERAAKLCGMNTEIEDFNIRNILAGFSDYVKAAEWAKSSLAFCYNEKILNPDVMKINPQQAVMRSEIAYMLYNMLNLSKLL